MGDGVLVCQDSMVRSVVYDMKSMKTNKIHWNTYTQFQVVRETCMYFIVNLVQPTFSLGLIGILSHRCDGNVENVVLTHA